MLPLGETGKYDAMTDAHDTNDRDPAEGGELPEPDTDTETHDADAPMQEADVANGESPDGQTADGG